MQGLSPWILNGEGAHFPFWGGADICDPISHKCLQGLPAKCTSPLLKLCLPKLPQWLVDVSCQGVALKSFVLEYFVEAGPNVVFSIASSLQTTLLDLDHCQSGWSWCSVNSIRSCGSAYSPLTETV